MFQYSILFVTFENPMTVDVIKSLLECGTMPQVEKSLPEKENSVTAFLIITTVRTPNDKIVAF
jgi:hypothetical protein